ncbi:unnamed protein product [Owenia fusiformis]|uniref:Uncharacterized protein n=1 Tax=Owenia fusiformis TaxID=6347 RepID=A0A8J1UWA1_OWEFU|nr:unnamed protein product [Owenia fusiformis]
MTTRRNTLGVFFFMTLLGFGLTSKYGPCKVKCRSLGLRRCSKICRIETCDTIDMTCWKTCSASINGPDAADHLRRCIQQCKVGKTCEAACNKTGFTRILKLKGYQEGPVFTKDGQFYTVLPWIGEIHRVDLENKQSSVLVIPSVDGFKGLPVGLQNDPEKNIWLADGRLGLLKMKQDGSFNQVATKDNKNEPMQGCNDLIFDYHGNLWITAPFGPIAPNNLTESRTVPFGSVYCYNTTTNEIIKVATGFLYPNGIAVQHDSNGTPKKLVFGSSFNISAPLWSFDIVGPCQIENKQVWGNLPANHVIDGIDFDENGNLLVTEYSSGILYVFDSNGGAPTCQLKMPMGHSTNIEFRPNSNEFYITGDALLKLQWKYNGMKKYWEIA